MQYLYCIIVLRNLIGGVRMAKKRITFTLEESTIDKLREVSKESMIPQARIIEDMIEKYLDSYKKLDK